jgi:DNA-binding Lrp family transcriptional regulator
MFHGLLFAYEKVFMNLYGDDARELYPYIIEELAHLMHTGDNPVIDKSKSLEENINRVIHFISNEEYVKNVTFKKIGKNKYVFDIGACSFAKSGVHDILKIKEGICPFGLVMASCLTELTPSGYVRVAKTSFDDEGSKTHLELLIDGDKGGEAAKKPHSSVDDEIFAIPKHMPPLDELDMKLLKELRRDARQANVDLAKVLGTSESTVRRRINSLMERGIVKGFTTLLQYEPGDSVMRTFIGLKVDPAHMEDVAKKLSDMKETCSVYKAIGKHNLICELIFGDRASFQDFIDRIQYLEGVMDVDYSIASAAPKPCPWYGF